jgi:hypothetical protein
VYISLSYSCSFSCSYFHIYIHVDVHVFTCSTVYMYMNISSTHSRTVKFILFLVPVKPDEGPGAANSLNTSDDIGLKPLLNVLLCTDSALHTS